MNSMQKQLPTLTRKLKEIQNLREASAVLIWDQQVMMPPGASEARAEQLATLDRLAHELFTSDEMGQMLSEGAQLNADPASDVARLIQKTRRDYDQARKLPPDLVAEMSRLFSLGQQVWTKARAEKDFSQFAESLTKIVDLNRRVAETYGYTDTSYDALLDLHEPDYKTGAVQQLFETLKAELVPLVQQITASDAPIDPTIFQQNFAEAEQWDLSMAVLRAIGYDFERGRQDKSVHPFTISFSMNDVRVTNRLSEDSFPASLFSALHEGGHGLYEQGIARQFIHTPLADAASLSVHESQSRLWEVVLGRSKPFWVHYYPKLQDRFPQQLGHVAQESFYKAINHVEPSFIRVEADELTYNLHIFLRFELEQALLTGQLKVADLPDAWNAKMESYLGITPPNDALGVLQDIHWSSGLMGYFPTYTMGMVLAVQLYNQAYTEHPDLPEQFRRGEFGTLLAWFREKVHQHGRKFSTTELIQQITGDKNIVAQPYLAYLKQKFGEIYNL